MRMIRHSAVLTLIVAALTLSPQLDAQKKDPKSYVQVSPDTAMLEVGAQTQLRAAVLDPVGFDLETNRKLTWKSSDATVATVSSTGLVTAVKAGVVTITAKSGPALGTAAITVKSIVVPPNTAPTVTITGPADGATVPDGSPITFIASATDPQDGDLSPAIAWTAAAANDPNAVQVPLGTGAAISGSLPHGSYLVTAGVTDSGGLGNLAQIGITVGCSFVFDMNPPSGEQIPQQLQLDASGSHDTCGRPVEYHWSCFGTVYPNCVPFLDSANNTDFSNATPVYRLDDMDTVVIGLRLCIVGTTECSPLGSKHTDGTQEWIYSGAFLGSANIGR